MIKDDKFYFSLFFIIYVMTFVITIFQALSVFVLIALLKMENTVHTMTSYSIYTTVLGLPGSSVVTTTPIALIFTILYPFSMFH